MKRAIFNLEKIYYGKPKHMYRSLQVAGYIKDKIEPEPYLVVAGLLHNYRQVGVDITPFGNDVYCVINSLKSSERYLAGKDRSFQYNKYFIDSLLLKTGIDNSRYYRPRETGLYYYRDLLKYISEGN